MKLTETDFVKWLDKRHEYDGGVKGWEDETLHLSVTDFCKSPQEVRLLCAHYDQLPKRDMKDSFRANMGTLIHSDFEKYFTSHYPNAICEKRKETTFDYNGKPISITGKVDMIHEGSLYDLKTRSVYSHGKENKFYVQGSLYKNMLFDEEITSNELTLVNLWHDWKSTNEEILSPITLETVNLMSKAETIEYISNWLKGFFDPESTCSDQDRWMSDTTYAIMAKPGAKRASKVCKTIGEANAALKPGQHVETRHGEPRKCLGFCPVADFCPQNNPGGLKYERIDLSRV